MKYDTFGDRNTSNSCWFKHGRFAASRSTPTPVRKLLGETAGWGGVDRGRLLSEDVRIDISDTYPVNCVLQICAAILSPSYTTSRHQVCSIMFIIITKSSILLGSFLSFRRSYVDCYLSIVCTFCVWIRSHIRSLFLFNVFDSSFVYLSEIICLLLYRLLVNDVVGTKGI